MDIVVIAQFTHGLDGKGNNRFGYLCNKLAENFQNTVELITSNFSHETKKKKDDKINNCLYKITFIDEPGYPTNVCLRRLYSHYLLGRNLKKYLNRRNTPDVVYCAVPSLSYANVAAKYCKKNHVRFIVDIQDLWPEAFKLVFHVPVISDLLFAPMVYQANRIYSAADDIVAVSETYALRGTRGRKRTTEPLVVYLGTEKRIFDEYANTGTKQFQDFMDGLKRKVKIAYIGTLGHSYDLPVVFEAMRMLRPEIQEQIHFIIMGDGPKRIEFERAADGLPLSFMGKLKYSDMVWILRRCDVAVNPICKGSAGSIINKVCDYAMAGLPVINTQESREYRLILDEYDAGINCRCGCVDDVMKAIEYLYLNGERRREMSLNAQKMGEKLFDRAKTYQKIIKLICKEKTL